MPIHITSSLDGYLNSKITKGCLHAVLYSAKAIYWLPWSSTLTERGHVLFCLEVLMFWFFLVCRSVSKQSCSNLTLFQTQFYITPSKRLKISWFCHAAAIIQLSVIFMYPNSVNMIISSVPGCFKGSLIKDSIKTLQTPHDLLQDYSHRFRMELPWPLHHIPGHQWPQ